MPSDTSTDAAYVPTRIIIDVPFEGEPRVVERGGLADYLVEAILNRCAMQHQTMWELLPDKEDE